MRTVLMATAALALTACQPAQTPEATEPDAQTPAATAPAAVANDPAGNYRRADPSNATLTLARSGETWAVVIAAAGLPNGTATAADCEVQATGALQGEVITATVTSAGGMEESEMEANPGQVRITLGANGATVDDGQSVEGVGVAGKYCPIGSDISGRYVRKG